MADSEAPVFDPGLTLVGLDRTGGSRFIESAPGPPPRIDGWVIGAPLMTENAPHGGEMHPDGDEVLFLVSGHVEVVLEEGGRERRLDLVAGQGLVVPRGVWHRVVLREPSRLLPITPGPGGEHRPL